MKRFWKSSLLLVLLSVLLFVGFVGCSSEGEIESTPEPTPEVMEMPVSEEVTEEEPGPFPELIEAVMYMSPIVMEEFSIAGMTIAIVDAESGFTWTQGFGYADVENQVHVDKNTVFSVASISKTFTAVAVMQLVEEGILDLDTPLIEYLPEFSILPSPELGGDYRNITPRMLLTNTSGIFPAFMGYDWNTVGTYDPGYLNNMLENLSRYAMVAPEDSVFTYANNGFDVLGILVAELTGEDNYFDDFVSYMRQNIFEPAGMAHSSFAVDDIRAYLATPHLDAETPDTFLYTNALPTGGLFSSAYDMSRFMHIMLRGGGDLLSPSSVDQILTAHDFDFSASIGFMGYGLGTMHRITGHGFEFVGHGGTLPHYHSEMVFDVESGIGVFVSINTLNGMPVTAAIAPDILAEAVAEKTGELNLQPDRADPAAIPIELSVEELEAFTGLFLSAISYFIVELDDDGVLNFFTSDNPEFPMPLTPMSDGSFFSEFLERVWFDEVVQHDEEIIVLRLGNLGIGASAIGVDKELYIASDQFIDDWVGDFIPEPEGNRASVVTSFHYGVDVFGIAYFQSVNMHIVAGNALPASTEDWFESHRNIERDENGVVIAFEQAGMRFVRQ